MTYWNTIYHGLLLREHAPGKHHIVDAISGPEFATQEQGYTIRDFSIGGPFPVENIFERRDASTQAKDARGKAYTVYKFATEPAKPVEPDVD